MPLLDPTGLIFATTMLKVALDSASSSACHISAGEGGQCASDCR